MVSPDDARPACPASVDPDRSALMAAARRAADALYDAVWAAAQVGIFGGNDDTRVATYTAVCESQQACYEAYIAAYAAGAPPESV